MRLTSSLADRVTRYLPPVIPAEKHIVGDKIIGGAFLGVAALLRRKHPRASLAAGILGGATLGAALLTDFSGYSRKPLSLSHHRKVDLGLASLAVAIPSVLPLEDAGKGRIFIAGAVALTVLSNLTNFPPVRRDHR